MGSRVPQDQVPPTVLEHVRVRVARDRLNPHGGTVALSTPSSVRGLMRPRSVEQPLDVSQRHVEVCSQERQLSRRAHRAIRSGTPDRAPQASADTTLSADGALGDQ